MKCDQCGQEATVHELRVVNGKKVERHLCEACARKHNLLPPKCQFCDNAATVHLTDIVNKGRLGEDIGAFGGAFKVTQGFQEEFGQWRVIDPILERWEAGDHAAVIDGGPRWPVCSSRTARRRALCRRRVRRRRA